jgi:hypothetical protein
VHCKVEERELVKGVVVDQPIQPVSGRRAVKPPVRRDPVSRSERNPYRDRIEDYGVPILSYRALMRTYEALCATVKPARVVGIALNTRECGDEEARTQIERARAETGLPCDDVVRNGPQALYDAIAPALVKTAVLQA